MVDVVQHEPGNGYGFQVFDGRGLPGNQPGFAGLILQGYEDLEAVGLVLGLRYGIFNRDSQAKGGKVG
ncbi:MAG: hypothetical protein IIC51_06240 [Planctomycetes bacterium]|nr:hypothetical protein [Planctomycetota bacterium]